MYARKRDISGVVSVLSWTDCHFSRSRARARFVAVTWRSKARCTSDVLVWELSACGYRCFVCQPWRVGSKSQQFPSPRPSRAPSAVSICTNTGCCLRCGPFVLIDVDHTVLTDALALTAEEGSLPFSKFYTLQSQSSTVIDFRMVCGKSVDARLRNDRILACIKPYHFTCLLLNEVMNVTR